MPLRTQLGIALLLILVAGLAIAALRVLQHTEAAYARRLLEHEGTRLRIIAETLRPILHAPADSVPVTQLRLQTALVRYALLAPASSHTVLVDLSGHIAPLSDSATPPEFTASWAAIRNLHEGTIEEPARTFVVTTLAGDHGIGGQSGWKLFTLVPDSALRAEVQPIRKTFLAPLGAAGALVIGLGIVLLRQTAAGRRQRSPDGPGSPIPAGIPQLAQTHAQLGRLSQLIEQAPLPVIITDSDGLIEYVNPAFCCSSGYSPLEVIGKTPSMLTGDDLPATLRQEIQTTLSAGRRWVGELQSRRKDGAPYCLRALVLPLCDDRGRITHHAAIMEDITDRKRTEQSLAWIAPLFENTHDICCIKDLDLRVLAANRAFARVMGKASPEEIIGKTDAEIFGLNDDQEPVRSYMEDERHAQRLRPGEQLIREETLHCANGQTLSILTNKFPVFDQAGRLIATANISTDITALKDTERELILAKEKAEAASRAKSLFLAHMSHELRTPLNAINGIAATLAVQDIPPDSKKAAHIIQQGGQNLLGIIEEIIEYTGLQSADIPLEKQPFSLPEMILSTLRMASDPLRSRSIKLDYWVNPATPAEIVGDTRRIQQILLNLLANAVKFTERGRVHLHLETTEIADGRLRIQFAVLDTGIGIAAERIPEIFQPFVPSDAKAQTPSLGAGLGLCIAQASARLMGSEITVRSQPGKGSAFRFALTVEKSPDSQEPFIGYGAPGLAGKRALVIESDPARRALLSGMLRAWSVHPTILPPHRFSTSMAAFLPPCDFAIIDQDAIPLHTDEWTTSEGTSIPVLWLAHATPHAEHHDAGSALVRPFSPADLAGCLERLVKKSIPITITATTEHTAPLATRIPLRILAADDVATNREAIRVIFRHLGYEVQLVENGAEALAQLRQRLFDLVILDVQMPVMDGFAAAREIIRLQPDPDLRPKLVALTANAMPGDANACLEAGMDAYISKPVLPQKLESCITRLFEAGVPTQPTPPQSGAPTSEPMWVDEAQLDAILEAVDRNSALDLIQQLLGTFKNDYRERQPRLQQACRARDTAALIEVVHGLKGSSLILGWCRFSAHCTTTLNTLRQGSFDGWTTLPEEIQSLYDRSIAEMHHVLARRARPTQPAPSSTPSP